MGMTNQDAIKWLSNLKQDIGQLRHEGLWPYAQAIDEIMELLEEQETEIKALHLLVEWAEECGFGFDQFHDEYERYKDEIKDMKYIDGMIHVAKRTLEDHGAFEE